MKVTKQRVEFIVKNIESRLGRELSPFEREMVSSFIAGDMQYYQEHFIREFIHMIFAFVQAEPVEKPDIKKNKGRRQLRPVIPEEKEDDK